MTFGQFIADLRRAAGLSQAQVGARLKRSRFTVASWEQGRGQMLVSVASRYLAVVGASDAQVLQGLALAAEEAAPAHDQEASDTPDAADGANAAMRAAS